MIDGHGASASARRGPVGMTGVSDGDEREPVLRSRLVPAVAPRLRPRFSILRPVRKGDPGEDGLRKQGIRSYAFSAAGLLVNLLTGMMLARALDTDGRGELASILNLPQFVGIIAALSCSPAIAFGLARRGSDGSQLLGTWLLLLLFMGGGGIAVGEALIPTLLGAQGDGTIDLARLYMPMVLVVVVTEIVYGMLLGSQDFLSYNLLRLVLPAAVAAVYAALWFSNALTVEAALVATVCVSVPVLGTMSWRIITRYGVARPTHDVFRSTLWYGLRNHCTTFAGLANARMDVLLVPAFLTASSVGLYAVATSIAWMVIVISAQFAIIVMPLAVRQGLPGRRTIIKAAYVTLGFGVACAIVIALLAGVAINLVYGPAFGDAAKLVRILLPGAVLLSVSGVVGQGLNVLDKPFIGVYPTLVGATVTAVGVMLLADRSGTPAVAACWSASQLLVAAGLTLLYRRAAGLDWSDLLPQRSDLRSILRCRGGGAAT